MKKLLVVLLALVVIGSFASAQVTFGSWNRIGYSVYTQPASTAAASSAVYPGWSRADFTLQVIKDNAGIIANLELKPDGSLGTGDNIQAYVKLLDSKITLRMGKAYVDALRGKVGGSQAVGSLPTGDEDAIYTRFKMAEGLALEIAPVEGLFIGAVVNKAATVTDEFAAIQVGAGYTIKDLGQLRAGYYGNAGTDDFIQAAFAFTGVAGLTADLGMKYYTEAVAHNIPVTVGVKYSMDALNLMFRTQALIPSGTAAFDESFALNANYKVMDTLVIGADLGLSGIAGTAKTANVTPYVQYNIPGGGQLQIGFNAVVGLDAQPLGFCIPIVLTI